MQCRYIKGARLHLKDNAELKSLKGVKFHVEPPAGGYTGILTRYSGEPVAAVSVPVAAFSETIMAF